MSSKQDPCYELKVLLYGLSQQLSKEESDALVGIEELPARLKGESAFEVLMQLKMQGRFSGPSDSKLEDLAQIFKNINRFDLATKVTKHAKKNKKKDARCMHHGPCLTPDAKLATQLRVTQLQQDILTDQIEQLWKLAASEARQRRLKELIEELKTANELANKNLKRIGEFLGTEKRENSLSPQSSISSTSSGEDIISPVNTSTASAANPLEREILAKAKQRNLKSRSLPRGM